SVESTRGLGSSTDVTARPVSETGTSTQRHPAALAPGALDALDDDDDDTGDTSGRADTGDTGVVPQFDDEPTHPPAPAAAAPPPRGPGQRAATEESATATELGVTFDRSFEGTLSSLGPDGSVLEGPLG